MIGRLTTGQRILSGFCAAWLAVCSLLAVSSFHAEEHTTCDSHEEGCALCLFTGSQIESVVPVVAPNPGAIHTCPVAVALDTFIPSIEFLSPPGRAPPAFFLL